MSERLWYQAPADKWIEALPVGNGRLGAMVFGGVNEELLELNEDTLWSGRPTDNNEPGRATYFKQAREMAIKGDYNGAQACIEANISGKYVESYVSLGSLRLRFQADGEVSDYERTLDLANGVHRVSFQKGETRFLREVFVSHPDQTVVIRLTRDGPAPLAFALTMDSPLHHTVSCGDYRLELEGLCPTHVDPDYVESEEPVVYDPDAPGIRFRAVSAIATDGAVNETADALVVKNASEATVFLTARSNFLDWKTLPETAGVPYRDNALQDLNRAMARSYESLRSRHMADHQRLFGKVSLELSAGREDIPTDRRLAMYQEDPNDPGMAKLLFDYGRYLLIASSREDTQPANLQGIWNKEVRPPWSCNFTANINVEMNYWPALSCGLEECAWPLYRLTRDLAEAGQKTAREYYDADGFAVHHNVDIWRHCNPVGCRRRNGVHHDFWPVGGGWLAEHLYQHYRYTGDMEFLRENAYPCLREAARFYLDMLTGDGEGHRTLIPATSPENKFYYEGQVCGLSKTCTMTDAVLRDTFAHTLSAAELLDLDAELQARLKAALKDLPPYRIGEDGRLLEWERDYEEVEPAHRHVSHLYGLYPSGQISLRETPELAEACRRSLIGRTDEGTGWSLAWKVNLWARLGDGDHALRLLKLQLRPTTADTMAARRSGGGTYPNLLGAHPPFQIDGNFGICAGISEMLLQSGDGVVDLLPALPTMWEEGSVSGLRAVGGLRVSIAWRDGCMTEASVTAKTDRDVEIRCGAQCRTVHLAAGETYIWKGRTASC